MIVKVTDWSYSKIILNKRSKCSNCKARINFCRCYGNYRCLPLRSLKLSGHFSQKLVRSTKGIKGHDPLVDIYSLGIVIFFLKTGEHPFEKYYGLGPNQISLNLANWYKNKTMMVGKNKYGVPVISRKIFYDNQWKFNSELMKLVYKMLCPYKKLDWMDSKLINRPQINDIVNIANQFLYIHIE